MNDLERLPSLAAAHMDKHGWMQGVERSTDGQVCLTGALRFCEQQPGDWLIARAMLRLLNRAEKWNDQVGRTQAEVVAALRSVEITDVELGKTFGPQWEAVVALIRTAAMLSQEQTDALQEARIAAWTARWSAARIAAGSAAWGVAQDTRATGWESAWSVTWSAVTRHAAKDAVLPAVTALVIRDLIGSHGFTQAQYDLLVTPWAAVMGKVHPDDQ